MKEKMFKDALQIIPPKWCCFSIAVLNLPLQGILSVFFGHLQNMEENFFKINILQLFYNNFIKLFYFLSTPKHPSRI